MQEPNALPIANLQKRGMAFVIDDMIVAMLIMVIFYDQLSVFVANLQEQVALIASNMQANQEKLMTLQEEFDRFLLQFILIKWLYHGILIWQSGMTPGKYIMKIKTVSLDTGMTPPLMTAMMRSFLRTVSEGIFYIGFVMAFFTPLKQTLHDKLSRCVVVDV